MELHEFPKHGKRKRLRDRGEKAEANSEGDNGGELSRTDEKSSIHPYSESQQNPKQDI